LFIDIKEKNNQAAAANYNDIWHVYSTWKCTQKALEYLQNPSRFLEAKQGFAWDGGAV